MSQADQPSLETAIAKFETAERSLIVLRDQLPQLLDATSKFVAADQEMRSRTTTAVNALEEVRVRLREQIVSSDEIAKNTIDVYRSFAEVVDEFRQILQLLGSIDPAAMTRDLAELRRDGADNAIEVREIRRLTAELAKEHPTTLRRLQLLVPICICTLVATLIAIFIPLLS